MLNGHFLLGVVVGVGGVWAWHKFQTKKSS
jgi:hypothetical protein